jgi:hypothetical protein
MLSGTNPSRHLHHNRNQKVPAFALALVGAHARAHARALGCGHTYDRDCVDDPAAVVGTGAATWS